MKMLEGKTVVVGVCGGIAAYKVVEVVSSLKKMKAEVHVIMTQNATKLVAPLTFRSISHQPVVTDMFEEPGQWNVRHISLAEKADLFLIAPATANVIGKVANGIADDMLTTTVMATEAPVLFVPAMNFRMYANEIVQMNISKLKRLGYYFMEPGTGTMACGTEGKGRLPEPQKIVEEVVSLLGNAPLGNKPQEKRVQDVFSKNDLHGLKVLITAGPTQEAIDPVRYISNHSSGKMGYALADAAQQRGAEVRLVSGPVHIPAPPSVEVVRVTSAEQMYRAVCEVQHTFDVLIFTAAVADYRCETVADRKMKKTGNEIILKLIKNPDIAAEAGKNKRNSIHVGFCAETDHVEQNAVQKLKDKNFDLIVANDVTMEGAGFGGDTNIVKIFGRDGSVIALPLLSKVEVAQRILDEVMKQCKPVKRV